jgi:hypothetical protein
MSEVRYTTITAPTGTDLGRLNDLAASFTTVQSMFLSL